MRDRILPFLPISIALVTMGQLTLLFSVAGDSPKVSVSAGSPARQAWVTSRIIGSPDPPSPYRVEKVFPHLQFQQPTVLTMAPGTSRWYLAELTGRIYSFPHDPDIEQADVSLVVDLTKHIERVQHIYGMTFHPNFQQNGYVYICYLQGQGFAGDDRVSRFKVTGDKPPRLDPASEKLLLKWPTGGHNGCCLAFGPDGYLYISSGDGASPSPPDPFNTGQDISDFKSSILRIDVDRTEDGLPYAIPADNPFVNYKGARPEVWAYGFRNPWKMSFDSANGDLWCGDIGWEMWEMVFRVTRGGNYGWSIVEGGQPIRTDVTPGPTPIQPPVLIHPRSEFRSITGGFVYHGKALPDLEGAYLYGDYVTGQLWGLRYDGEQVTWKQELVDTRLPIITFAEDWERELYFVDYGKDRPGNREAGGSIYRLAPNDGSESNLDFPRTLSETGLFASVSSQELATGVIPYSIIAEAWADGARADRAVAIPNREQLTVHLQDQPSMGERHDAWNFPNNSVLVRTLSLDLVNDSTGATSGKRPVETQILHKDGEVWRGYTYAWNEEATDASLVAVEGDTRVLRVADPASANGVRQQTWHFSGRNECMVCHSARAGTVLGFTASQLSYDQGQGEGLASQLSALSDVGLFAQPVAHESHLMVSAADSTASLENRVRAYFDVNCSHCHGNGNGGTAQLRLQYNLNLEQTGLLGGELTQGGFGIQQPRIVAAGDPYRSVLYYRMSKLGKGQMPHIGAHVLDEAGLLLIHDWILSLPAAANEQASEARELASARSKQLHNLEKLKSGNRANPNALHKLLETPSGGLMLQHGLLVRDFSAGTRQDIIRAAAELENPLVRELFLHFLPEEERPTQVDHNPSHILAIAGDSRNGERLFFADKRLQCRLCHQVGDRGIAVGPQLKGIGRTAKPSDLLTSILFPSQKIEPEYVPWVLVTKDGVVHSGLLVQRNADGVSLRTTDGKVVKVPADNIEEMVAQNTSLMPQNALRDVSAKEAADLLAFLTSLK
ncbi:MAG: PQQ-dependent sugar dehydrogenase [Planctomycetales bacterium]|nr:PQQ-dependent sugar dehydrogenase [Planctomycetales bacterium]